MSFDYKDVNIKYVCFMEDIVLSDEVLIIIKRLVFKNEK